MLCQRSVAQIQDNLLRILHRFSAKRASPKNRVQIFLLLFSHLTQRTTFCRFRLSLPKTRAFSRPRIRRRILIRKTLVRPRSPLSNSFHQFRSFSVPSGIKGRVIRALRSQFLCASRTRPGTLPFASVHVLSGKQSGKHTARGARLYWKVV